MKAAREEEEEELALRYIYLQDSEAAHFEFHKMVLDKARKTQNKNRVRSAVVQRLAWMAEKC